MKRCQTERVDYDGYFYEEHEYSSKSTLPHVCFTKLIWLNNNFSEPPFELISIFPNYYLP